MASHGHEGCENNVKYIKGSFPQPFAPDGLPCIDRAQFSTTVPSFRGPSPFLHSAPPSISAASRILFHGSLSFAHGCFHLPDPQGVAREGPNDARENCFCSTQVAGKVCGRGSSRELFLELPVSGEGSKGEKNEGHTCREEQVALQEGGEGRCPKNKG